MKKHFSFSGLLVSGLVLVAVFMSSCGSKPSYKAAIPTDAPIVMEINMQSLTLKSNILSYKELLADILVAGSDDGIIQKFADELRKADDGGMNFENPVYVFTDANMDNAFLLTAVKNRGEIIDLMLSLPNRAIRAVEDEGAGVTWLEKDGKPMGVLTDELFILGTAKDRLQYETLLACKGEFFATKMGKSMESHAGDMTLMVNMPALNEQKSEELVGELVNNIAKQGKDISPMMLGNVFSAIRNLQLVANLKFLKGQIVLNVFAGDDEDHLMMKKIEPEVFAKVPAQRMIGMIAVGLDGASMAEYVTKTVENSGVALDNDTRVGLAMINSFIKQMDGTAAVAAYLNNEQPEVGVVGWLPMAKSRLNFLFKTLKDAIGFDLYLDGDKDFSTISNMSKYRCVDYPVPFNMAEHATSCYMYGYLDLNMLINKGLEIGRMRVKPSEIELYEAVAEVANVIDYAEMKMEKYNEISFVLNLADDSRNSLDLLIAKTFELGISAYKYLQTQQVNVWNSIMPEDNDDFDAQWDALETVEEVEW